MLTLRALAASVMSGIAFKFGASLRRPASSVASSAPSGSLFDDGAAPVDTSAPKFISSLGEGSDVGAHAPPAKLLVIPLRQETGLASSLLPPPPLLPSRLPAPVHVPLTQSTSLASTATPSGDGQAADQVKNEPLGGNDNAFGGGTGVVIAQNLTSLALERAPAVMSIVGERRVDLESGDLRARLFRADQKRVRGDASAPPLLLRTRGADELGEGAPDIDVTAVGGAFERVPIDEFGAAMLRGMGAREGDLRDAERFGLTSSRDGEGLTTAVLLPGEMPPASSAAVIVRGERLGLGAASNPLLLLEAYERLRRQPRRPGDPPLPPPPPAIAHLLGGSGMPATAGAAATAPAAANVGLAKAPPSAADKAALIRQRKHPGLVDGAIVRVGGSGLSGLLAVVLQTVRVPGLDRCRLQLLEAADVGGSDAAVFDSSLPLAVGATTTASKHILLPVRAVLDDSSVSASASAAAASADSADAVTAAARVVEAASSDTFTLGLAEDAATVELKPAQTDIVLLARAQVLKNALASALGSVAGSGAPTAPVQESQGSAAVPTTALDLPPRAIGRARGDGRSGSPEAERSEYEPHSYSRDNGHSNRSRERSRDRDRRSRSTDREGSVDRNRQHKHSRRRREHGDRDGGKDDRRHRHHHRHHGSDYASSRRD